ncbi:hypothetical protein K437DRAFT_81095 [Tilletiaria anomala UBC 951]|uniref:Uncharacterized protein n=1 Tax=Tilletiaria anomala (strain ATCC 24038 / CBS 436.72 / UBC 951) TaxID=1037660 RepID=A0A066WDN5_TILAU|nr:uncharacterized protein K437DRAFT_81095 [Tilletiaria anomala UBC 951]KDN48850.1 hypothetical protein K437DRAFT_81095 [Tilletiaria anomala UBC 951]
MSTGIDPCKGGWKCCTLPRHLVTRAKGGQPGDLCAAPGSYGAVGSRSDRLLDMRRTLAELVSRVIERVQQGGSGGDCRESGNNGNSDDPYDGW